MTEQETLNDKFTGLLNHPFQVTLLDITRWLYFTWLITTLYIKMNYFISLTIFETLSIPMIIIYYVTVMIQEDLCTRNKETTFNPKSSE